MYRYVEVAERQTYNGTNPDAEGSSLFVAQVVWGLDLDIPLDDNVLSKCPVFRLDRVCSVGKATDAIPWGEGLGDPAADLLDDARIVTAYSTARVAIDSLDVLPVGWVEGHGRGAHQDVVLAEGW